MESEKYLRYCGPCKCGRNPTMESKMVRIQNNYLVWIRIYCSNNVNLLNYDYDHNQPLWKSEFKNRSDIMILDVLNRWNTSRE